MLTLKGKMDYKFNEVREYSRAILLLRKVILISKLSILVSILTIGVSYYVVIADYFQPYDLTNSTIIEAMMDKDYQSISTNTFDILNKYNSGESKIKPSDFYAFLPGRYNATSVHVHGHLVPMGESIHTSHNNFTMYRYDFTYRVSISQFGVMIFSLIQVFLLSSFLYLHFSTKSKHENDFEDKIVGTYFDMLSHPLEERELSDVEKLKLTLRKFNAFRLALNNRYDNRPGYVINDEYDVQDLLRAILALNFEDVIKESAIPYYLGSNSRVDFLIRDQSIAIEVKKTRKELRDGKLADQIISDLHRYQAYSACKDIIFFVYDPDHFIQNPASLKKDIKSIKSEATLHFVIVPEV